MRAFSELAAGAHAISLETFERQHQLSASGCNNAPERSARKLFLNYSNCTLQFPQASIRLRENERQEQSAYRMF